MDLPLCRMRQIVEAIKLRLKDSDLRERKLLEWQTKTLAGIIAATVQVPKGKQNPLFAEVEKITLTTKEENPAEAHTPPETDPSVFVEQGSTVAADRNRVGSFERLTRGKLVA